MDQMVDFVINNYIGNNVGEHMLCNDALYMHMVRDSFKEVTNILKLKGRGIEYIYYQDYLDGSIIEETIILLILLLNGLLNDLSNLKFI